MPRPYKHPKTGVFYFRQKTPADLRQKFGKAEVSWTLATKVESEAIIRNAEAVLKQAKVWQSLRATPSALPHKQIMALVGEYRRQLDTMLNEEPGEVGIWDSVLKLQTANGADPIALEKWQGKEADALLLAAGLEAPIVVFMAFPRTIPRKPIPFMRRATMQRATASPSRHSCRQALRAP